MWLAKGFKREDVFLELLAPQLGMHLVKGERFGVDFIDSDGTGVELKYCDQPFFIAERVLGMQPQYCVPLNCASLKRYPPDTLIVFWVQWPKLDKYNIRVKPMKGLWSVRAGDIPTSDTTYRHHFYAARSKKDTQCGTRDPYGNNVCSRYLDLRDLTRLDTPTTRWK
jgi:hypothetical protein